MIDFLRFTFDKQQHNIEILSCKISKILFKVLLKGSGFCTGALFTVIIQI